MFLVLPILSSPLQSFVAGGPKRQEEELRGETPSGTSMQCSYERQATSKQDAVSATAVLRPGRLRKVHRGTSG
jgi:hypothetical protein